VLDIGTVVYDPETEEKAEPFCFDARRAPNAHSRDIGFSPNVLKLTTTAFPAVEALAFVGLQRCRPSAIAGRRRQFEYCTWDAPMPIALAAPLVAGSVRSPGTRRFRFDLYFRTDYLKAFRPAVLIDNGESPNA
jgi:CRISPR-associated protein Csb3